MFERVGIAFAASVMNAVILTAILSAGNSGLYSSARMLFSMAHEGKAPKFFTRVTKRGVPIHALLATSAVGLFGFLTAVMGQGAAYAWLVNISGLSGFIVWVGIAVCHYRFRRAYVRQGYDLRELPYRAPMFPLGPILAFTLCLVVILGQNYEAFFAGELVQVLSTYIGIPIFLALWLGHKVLTKDRTVPLDEIDVTGVRIDNGADRTTTATAGGE